jgi:hypothetical protein
VAIGIYRLQHSPRITPPPLRWLPQGHQEARAKTASPSEGLIFDLLSFQPAISAQALDANRPAGRHLGRPDRQGAVARRVVVERPLVERQPQSIDRAGRQGRLVGCRS